MRCAAAAALHGRHLCRPYESFFRGFVGDAYMRPVQRTVCGKAAGKDTPSPAHIPYAYRFVSFFAASPDSALMTSTSTSNTTAVP